MNEREKAAERLLEWVATCKEGNNTPFEIMAEFYASMAFNISDSHSQGEQTLKLMFAHILRIHDAMWDEHGELKNARSTS